MFWKIYFWGYLVLTVLGVLLMLKSIQTLTFANWEGIIEGVILLVGVYSYTFKRHIFKLHIWKMIFWYLAVVWAVAILYSLGFSIGAFDIFFKTNYPINTGVVVFSIILALPGLFAIFLLSEKKSSKK